MSKLTLFVGDFKLPTTVKLNASSCAVDCSVCHDRKQKVLDCLLQTYFMI